MIFGSCAFINPIFMNLNKGSRMKFGKLFYVLLSTVLVTVFILISNIFAPIGTPGVSGSNVVKIYFADYISPSLQKVINEFNEKYAGQIEVHTINLPFTKFSTNERKELLARYLRSKSERIDVFSVDQIWVPRFAKWGISMDKYFDPAEKEGLLNYALETCNYNDTLVAIPLYIDVALLYYRKDILGKLPDYKKIEAELDSSITWKQFIKLHDEMKAYSNPFYLFQADDYEGLICSFSELMGEQNTPFIVNGKLKLNTPQARRAAQLLVDLVQKYKISPKQVVQFKEDPSYEYFLKKNGVFLRGWPSFGTHYQNDSTYKYVVKNIGKAPTPHFENSRSSSVYGGWNLMISQFSNHVPEAVKFVNYLISPEAQKQLYENGGYLPVNKSIYDDTEFVNEHPDLKFYERLLKHGYHRPFLERYTSISDILSYYLNEAIKGKISVDKALRTATEKVNSESILIK